MLARYDFVGSLEDVSGFNRDLTALGSVAADLDRFQLQAAENFSGGNLYNNIITDLAAGTTLTAWVKPSTYDATNLHTIAWHGTTAGFGLVVVGSDGSLCFGAGTEFLCSDIVLPLDVWTHVALVGDTARTWKLYVNGSTVREESLSGLPASVSGLYVGKNGLDAKPFFGLISDVRLYSRPFLTEEIRALVQQPNRYIRVSSSESDSGDMGGVAGADTICQSEYGSRYKALLVAEDGSRRACQSPDCSVGGIAEHVDWVLRPNATYLNEDDEPVFTANWNGIFAFDTQQNPIGTFTGEAWTGLDNGWTPPTTHTCDSWQSSTMVFLFGATGQIHAIGESSVSHGDYGCGEYARLYCVEQ